MAMEKISKKDFQSSKDKISKNKAIYYSKKSKWILEKQSRYYHDHEEELRQKRQQKAEQTRRYNRLYKEKNRAKINRQATQYQAKRRRITKMIRPSYALEALEGEPFSKFYTRKVKEFKERGVYDSL